MNLFKLLDSVPEGIDLRVVEVGGRSLSLEPIRDGVAIDGTCPILECTPEGDVFEPEVGGQSAVNHLVQTIS